MNENLVKLNNLKITVKNYMSSLFIQMHNEIWYLNYLLLIITILVLKEALTTLLNLK